MNELRGTLVNTVAHFNAGSISEMNRHIEKLIELKADVDLVRVAANDRHSLIDPPKPERLWWEPPEPKKWWRIL